MTGLNFVSFRGLGRLWSEAFTDVSLEVGYGFLVEIREENISLEDTRFSGFILGSVDEL